MEHQRRDSHESTLRAAIRQEGSQIPSLKEHVQRKIGLARTPEGGERLASGDDVVQNGIEFSATPSSKRPPAGRCLSSRTTGHNLGVAQSSLISVGRSWQRTGRWPEFFYCLQVKRVRSLRVSVSTWTCVHVRSIRLCARDSSTCLSEKMLAVKRQG